DEEVDEQELEAHYSYIAKIQEAPNADSGTNSEPVEQTEFEKYKAFNDRTIDYDKLERKLTEALDLFRAPTALDMEILIQTCLMPLAIKTQSDSLKFVHELKQEMHADLNKKDHTELLQHFAKVEKHSTSLELALQKCKEQIIQLILFIVDSGCTKNMTGNLKLLYNFVEKFMGTVRFGNDQFAPILGYGDLVQGNVTINKGNDLLTINRGSDLYTISLQESTSSTPLCLMAKATPTQAWLWQRRLSHLNFDYINLVSMKDIVIGLPKLKYVKDQLCSSCELSKAKRSSFKSKGRLNLLHMDLCGPIRVASINGKKYILVIIDDYSRYTWTLFLRFKDETPEVLKDFLTMIQRNLQDLVITVRTDRGIKFLNKTLNAFFKVEGIEHQTSTSRTPNRTALSKDGTVL
nr:hypothetical protein [Tanacetum cinerariifolium]